MTAQFSVFVPIMQESGLSLETLNQGTGAGGPSSHSISYSTFMLTSSRLSMWVHPTVARAWLTCALQVGAWGGIITQPLAMTFGKRGAFIASTLLVAVGRRAGLGEVDILYRSALS